VYSLVHTQYDSQRRCVEHHAFPTSNTTASDYFTVARRRHTRVNITKNMPQTLQGALPQGPVQPAQQQLLQLQAAGPVLQLQYQATLLSAPVQQQCSVQLQAAVLVHHARCTGCQSQQQECGHALLRTARVLLHLPAHSPPVSGHDAKPIAASVVSA
jgi:hypothetical protein